MVSFPHAIFNICQIEISEFKLEILPRTLWQNIKKKKKSQKYMQRIRFQKKIVTT